MRFRTAVLAVLLAGSPPLARAQAGHPIKVVTTLPTYAAIARAVVGDRGTVTAIAQGADLDAIVASILRLSALCSDFPEVQELDINPLVVSETGAIALDARIILTA